MLQKIRKRSGQSTLEYAILIMIVIAALVTVQQYIKKGIMGRAKEATDDISTTQFDPALATYQTITNKSGTTQESQYANGESSSLLIGNETTNVTTNMYY